MKIPFDIKYRPQIESGEYKVVTADDHPVRICCWNAEEDWPIVALVKDYNEKSDYCYPMMCDTAGVSATKGKQKQLYVITPEPELTEFEIFLAKILETFNGVEIDVSSAVAAYAPTLLRLASKGLQLKYDATKVDEQLIEKMVNDKFKQFDMVVNPENTKHFYKQGLCDMYKQFAAELEEAFKHQDDVVYNQGYDMGRYDTLKDLPHWHKGEPPYKSWWLIRKTQTGDAVSVSFEPFKNDKWPYGSNSDVLYMNPNELIDLPLADENNN